MATKVEFKRVQTDEEVENIDIKDGQLIYTGTGKTYMDYGSERIPTGSGSITLDTEMSDTSENAVQNKVIKEYVDSQTVPEEVIISDTQPTSDDWKLWIDTGEIAQAHTEITNSYSTSTGLGYSANYVNNNFQTTSYETGSGNFDTSSQFSGNYQYVKCGKIAQLYAWIVLSANISTPWTTLTLVTLPDKIKPKLLKNAHVMRDNDNKMYLVTANTDGTLKISDRGRGNITASAEGIPVTLTYIVDD